MSGRGEQPSTCFRDASRLDSFVAAPPAIAYHPGTVSRSRYAGAPNRLTTSEDQLMAIDLRTGKLADVAALDHVNIRTNDLDACRRFYVDALGFEEGLRPPFDSRGIWLYLDGAPVVHVLEVSEAMPKNGGSIDHIAFRARNFDRFTARLKANGIDYEDRAVPGMDLHQLFCFDPHGIKVEFNFEGQDRPWATIEKEHEEMKKSAPGVRGLPSAE